jgi:hypothetical protein
MSALRAVLRPALRAARISPAPAARAAAVAAARFHASARRMGSGECECGGGGAGNFCREDASVGAEPLSGPAT